VVVQVSRPPLAHCVAPAVHAVAQAPALQVTAHAEPAFCQVPVASQVWGCWPLHCVAPVVHVPVQVPLLQM
jgi:hypothetical protein